MSAVDGEVDVSASSLLDQLEAVVGRLQTADLDGRSAEEELLGMRQLEVVRRKLDHATGRMTGHLDQSGAFSLDGHRNAKAALKHLGRLSGPEAFGRVRAARALRRLPAVEAAYSRGEIPTEFVRMITRSVSNPRVTEFVDVADPVFAEQAATEPHDDFRGWLSEWESQADADGAAEATEQTHERRNFAILENDIDGSWIITGLAGALQGAAMDEILSASENAEFEADWAEARQLHGDDARVEHLARTPAQRRADALFNIFRRAASMPADAKSPVPLVNIIIDQDSFEDEIRRAAGEAVDADPMDLTGRRCQTRAGTRLHPSDAVAAALIGHVRRVVVDAKSNVIDLGRRRRLFTGSSREAAELQGILRGSTGLRCLWPGCDCPRCQLDHREPSARGGPTDVANSDPYCGGHNRIKERGFIPVRDPDGTWTIHRPDNGGPITPSA